MSHPASWWDAHANTPPPHTSTPLTPSQKLSLTQHLSPNVLPTAAHT